MTQAQRVSEAAPIAVPHFDPYSKERTIIAQCLAVERDLTHDHAGSIEAGKTASKAVKAAKNATDWAFFALACAQGGTSEHFREMADLIGHARGLDADSVYAYRVKVKQCFTFKDQLEALDAEKRAKASPVSAASRMAADIEKNAAKAATEVAFGMVTQDQKASLLAVVAIEMAMQAPFNEAQTLMLQSSGMYQKGLALLAAYQEAKSALKGLGLQMT